MWYLKICCHKEWKDGYLFHNFNKSSFFLYFWELLFYCSLTCYYTVMLLLQCSNSIYNTCSNGELWVSRTWHEWIGAGECSSGMRRETWTLTHWQTVRGDRQQKTKTTILSKQTNCNQQPMDCCYHPVWSGLLFC